MTICYIMIIWSGLKVETHGMGMAMGQKLQKAPSETTGSEKTMGLKPLVFTRTQLQYIPTLQARPTPGVW